MSGDGPGCRGAIVGGADANRVLKKADLDGIGSGGSPLHIASMRGHDAVASLLLAHKADPNATTNRGETPVHLASRNGHVGVVKLLIAHGASSTQTDKHGMLPIARAPSWSDKKRRQLNYVLNPGSHGKGSSGQVHHGVPTPPPCPTEVKEEAVETTG